MNEKKSLTIVFRDNDMCSVIPINMNPQDLYKALAVLSAHIASQMIDKTEIYKLLTNAGSDALAMINDRDATINCTSEIPQ